MVDEQSFTSDLLPPLSSQLGPNSRSCSLSNDSLGHPCQSSFPPIPFCLVSKALRDMEGRHGRHQIQEYQLIIRLVIFFSRDFSGNFDFSQGRNS